MEPEVPIEFVHQGHKPKEWEELKQFWTEVKTPTPGQPVSFIGLSPLHAAALALVSKPTYNRTIKVKVPLGLDDPKEYIPASNRPTLGKWELGKELFFDDSWLNPDGPTVFACASCHRPGTGFGERLAPRGDYLRAPTLLNTLYNSNLFWDGRANALEEVVQRTLEDERENPNVDPNRRHAWSGVVARLRADLKYSKRFEQVFGTPPTQDAIGKALATYMRTLLSGNSLYDRALRDSGGKPLEAAHFEKYLDEAALKAFERDGAKKADVAKELATGANLFRLQARCAQCHTGSNFTDNGFHNLGVGDSSLEPLPGREPGRFAALPVGIKDPTMIGAYKTPTLRSVPLNGTYFHDGFRNSLVDVVMYIVKGGTPNAHLDPKITNLNLKEPEVRALVLFLQALDGQVSDPIVSTPPKKEDKEQE